MNKVLRWLASSVGYLLYTAVALVVMLWVLLPVDSIRLWLQARLNAADPALHWEIKELHVALPGGLVATDLRLSEAGKSGAELLQVAELRLLPDVRTLLANRKQFPFLYRLRTGGGTLQGKAALLEDRSRLRLEGDAEKLKLELLKSLWSRLGRTVSGTLLGHYRFEGTWSDPYQGVLTAQLKVADGSINLQQPLFGLDRFEFSQLSSSLELKDRALALNQGKVESRLLAAEFKGSVSLADPLPMSQLKIDGSLEPRSELLSGLRDQSVVALIKKQLRNNRLSFVLSGTALAPGIQFQGASGTLDGIIQGGGVK